MLETNIYDMNKDRASGKRHHKQLQFRACDMRAAGGSRLSGGWDWAVGPGEGRGVVHCRWLADLGRPGRRPGRDGPSWNKVAVATTVRGPWSPATVRYEYSYSYSYRINGHIWIQFGSCQARIRHTLKYGTVPYARHTILVQYRWGNRKRTRKQ